MPIAKPPDYSFFQTSVKSHSPDVTCESNFLHPAHFGAGSEGLPWRPLKSGFQFFV